MVSNRRTETDAYKANSEIMGKLHTEDSLFYKPWQFADYDIQPSTLKTTYEEINIWGKAQAMMRPGWRVENGKVYIPNLFVKINGVHPRIKQYRKEMKFLRKEPNTLLFYRFPLYNTKPRKISGKNYYSVLDQNRIIDRTKLLSAPFWKYRHLRTGLQRNIADRIIDFCNLYRFKNYKVDNVETKGSSFMEGFTTFLKTFDININLTPSSDDPAKIKVFEILLSIEESFLKLLSLYDYPHAVPKIIVYNNGDRYSKIKFEDAVKLMFMSSMGVDVLVYNPAGYNDIEDFIDERFFDVHRLEDVAFNLPYSSWLFF